MAATTPPRKKLAPPPKKQTPPPAAPAKKAPPAPAKKKKPAPARSLSNTAHSILGPSYGETWVYCAASLAMAIGLPVEEGNSASVDGTGMHAVSEICGNNFLSGSSKHDPKEWIGCKPLLTASNKNTPEGNYTFVADHAKLITPYVNHIKAISTTAVRVWLEKRIALNEVLGIDIKETPIFGTGDLVALEGNDDGTFTLVVGDLKTGRNKVAASGYRKSGNTQLMLYALGLLHELAGECAITKVRLEIHGPRMGLPDGMDVFTLSVDAFTSFKAFAAKAARKALDLLKAGKRKLKAADFKPSESACKWCKAREVCGARAKWAADELRTAGDDEPAPECGIEMTPEYIAAQYAKIPALKDHIATIEAAMNKLMYQGDGAPGYKLVTVGGGNRMIRNESKVISILRGARFTDKDIYVSKIKSPAQIEAMLVEKGKDDLLEEVRGYFGKPEDKPAIAPADDKRPEWQAADKKDLSLE